MTDRLLSVQDVAALVGLSDSTVREAIRAGELPASRLRRRLRVDPADLAGWVQDGRVSAASSRVDVHVPASVSAVPATPDNVRELIARQRRGRAA